MRRLGILILCALGIVIGNLPAAVMTTAQNVICTTAPIGTDNNQCASTAFVQNALPGGGAVVSGATLCTGCTVGDLLGVGAGPVVVDSGIAANNVPLLNAANAFTNTTASTSTTTGALTVAGGVGIAGAVHAGGAFVSTNTIAVQMGPNAAIRE